MASGIHQGLDLLWKMGNYLIVSSLLVFFFLDFIPWSEPKSRKLFVFTAANYRQQEMLHQQQKSARTTIFRNMDLKGRNFQGSYFCEWKSQKFANIAEFIIPNHIAFCMFSLKITGILLESNTSWFLRNLI